MSVEAFSGLFIIKPALHFFKFLFAAPGAESEEANSISFVSAVKYFDNVLSRRRITVQFFYASRHKALLGILFILFFSTT